MGVKETWKNTGKLLLQAELYLIPEIASADLIKAVPKAATAQHIMVSSLKSRLVIPHAKNPTISVFYLHDRAVNLHYPYSTSGNQSTVRIHYIPRYGDWEIIKAFVNITGSVLKIAMLARANAVILH